MEAAQAVTEIDAAFVTVVTVKLPPDRAKDPHAIRQAIADTLKMYEESMQRAGIALDP